MHKITYYKEGETVKGKFVNCDTNSSYFLNMEKVVKEEPDAKLEASFKAYQEVTVVPDPIEKSAKEVMIEKGLASEDDFEER